MGSITINGKNVKKWVIGGKTVKSLTMGGKALTLVKIDPNAFTGTFSTTAKQGEFMSVTNIVISYQFFSENYLTGITLPGVTTIGNQAFAASPLTYIDVKKATDIGSNVFQHVVNAKSTQVFMNRKYKTSDNDKNSIFGFNNWNHITFYWFNDDGTPANLYIGYLSSTTKTNEFMNAKTSVSDYQFSGQLNLTGISMQNLLTVGVSAFAIAPLTTIYLPKVETIGNNAFNGAVNSATTQVYLKSKFNTPSELERIFGVGRWSNITFHWL